MLWLCLFLPQFSLELRQPGGERLVSGVEHKRSRSQEKRSLKALAGWAEQFSGFVCFDAQRRLLWIEIGASLRYFGGLETLLEQVSGSLAILGHTAIPGVAPTLEGAALLACHTERLQPVLKPGRLCDAISALPLTLLALPQRAIEGLRKSGLKTIGEVLQLPRDALARRWGPETTEYLQRLLGERPDPRPRYRAPPIYRRRFEFADPVESIEGLLFPLRRLLYELQGYLRGRDTALQLLSVAFVHHDHEDTVLELRTTEPQREAMRLFALLREKLERTSLSEPVLEILLRADRFVAMGNTQLPLFDSASRRDAQWSDLLDRLRARLGDRALRRLDLSDDHLPEKAWCVQREEPQTKGQTQLSTAFPDRPLWLLEPRPISHPPRLLGKPERIEAGWWTGEDASRDYYIAETEEGSRWWLYREIETARWFLQGIWA